MINKRSAVSVSIILSVNLFVFLNFFVGPSSLSGLVEFIMNQTGYYIGLSISTYDYLLCSSIPILAVLLVKNSNSASLVEIFTMFFFLSLSCIFSFIFGLFILVFIVGSPSSNPLFPQYLRVEPFEMYSVLFIALGLVAYLLVHKKKNSNFKESIDEIGEDL